MTTDELWTLVDLVDRARLGGNGKAAVAPLEAALATRTEADLEGFEELLARALFDLDTRAHRIESGASRDSPDGFLYARCHVVAMGRAHYERVLANPATFPKTLDEWCEDLLYVASNAWATRTGNQADTWGFSPSVNYETGSNTAKG